MIYHRLIATGANSLYFGSLINLLGSVYRHYPDVDVIYVYDLGLSALERLILKNLQNVQLKTVPPFCPHYLEILNFAWKTTAICDALEDGRAVLWLDAGVELQTSIEDLFVTIETDGYLFCVTPLDQPNAKIGSLSHARSLELLDADTSFIRSSLMVNAGVMGYLRGHMASDIAYAAKRYAANPEIVKGPRTTHRHDQTIYSVLRVKNGYCPQYHIFHVEKIQTYPFLMRASQPGIVPFDQIASWERSNLHIYLHITRDREPFSHVDYLWWGNNSIIPRYLLLARKNELEYQIKNWLVKIPYLQQVVHYFKQKG